MRFFIALITLLVATLSGCSSTPSSYYAQQCINTTERMSAARWSCIQDANARDQQDLARQKQMAKVEMFRQRCDGYGFRRGTTEFSQCLQQAEQQQTMDNAVQMQANELNRQNQERLFRKSQCYLTGRLDC